MHWLQACLLIKVSSVVIDKMLKKKTGKNAKISNADFQGRQVIHSLENLKYCQAEKIEKVWTYYEPTIFPLPFSKKKKGADQL